MLPVHQGQGMISHLQWTKMVRLWRGKWWSFFENMSHKKMLTPLPMTMIVGIDAFSFWDFIFLCIISGGKSSFTIFRPRGVLLFLLFSFKADPVFTLPSPPTSTLHPSPDRHGVQRHRHTFCAEEFCRPGWWQSKLAVNRS